MITGQKASESFLFGILRAEARLGIFLTLEGSESVHAVLALDRLLVLTLASHSKP